MSDCNTRQPIILVLGGTFDPIHYGHLALLNHARSCVAADLCLVMPNAEPQHRPPCLATASQRYQMVCNAFADDALVQVSDLEMTENPQSRTWRTAELLRDSYPGSIICWILGMDAYQSLAQWENESYLREQVAFLVFDRAGVGDAESGRCRYSHYSTGQVGNTQWLRAHHSNSALFCYMPPCSISSTQIRATIRAGDCGAHWVPAAVWQTIVQQELYRA